MVTMIPAVHAVEVDQASDSVARPRHCRLRPDWLASLLVLYHQILSKLFMRSCCVLSPAPLFARRHARDAAAM